MRSRDLAKKKKRKKKLRKRNQKNNTPFYEGVSLLNSFVLAHRTFKKIPLLYAKEGIVHNFMLIIIKPLWSTPVISNNWHSNWMRTSFSSRSFLTSLQLSNSSTFCTSTGIEISLKKSNKINFKKRSIPNLIKRCNSRDNQRTYFLSRLG